MLTQLTNELVFTCLYLVWKAFLYYILPNFVKPFSVLIFQLFSLAKEMFMQNLSSKQHTGKLYSRAFYHHAHSSKNETLFAPQTPFCPENVITIMFHQIPTSRIMEVLSNINIVTSLSYCCLRAEARKAFWENWKSWTEQFAFCILSIPQTFISYVSSIQNIFIAWS